MKCLFKYRLLSLSLLIIVLFTFSSLKAQDNYSDIKSRNEVKNVSFYPNPMTDFTRLYFTINESGKTVISIYDLTGKKILNAEFFLEKGQHSCHLEGINKGMYIVTINSGKYMNTARLVSASTESNDPKLRYINMSPDQDF